MREGDGGGVKKGCRVNTLLFCLVLVSAVDLCARGYGAGAIAVSVRGCAVGATDVSEVVLLMSLMRHRLCCWCH